jgi:hypothetical protein
MFQPHPSVILNRLFEHKPFQGVNPLDATFLFVGLDANYAPDVESSPVFQDILAYHDDGAAFWRRSGVHHPFLLPDYRGDGRPYHRRFSRIGFRPEHAQLVSFVELLHLPSVGQSALVPNDLDAGHLHWLSNAILGGQARHIFVPADVERLMKATRAFPWLGKPKPTESGLSAYYQADGRTVYKHLHFSNYGKFEGQLQAEERAIGALLLNDQVKPHHGQS